MDSVKREKDKVNSKRWRTKCKNNRAT